MSSKNPFDPLGVGAMSMDVWRAMMTSPGALLEAQAELAKPERVWRGVAAPTNQGCGPSSMP